MTTQSNMQTNTQSAMQDESGALAGLKVVDLMWVVAGPTATRLLADFGATVVRIESANRIETARGIGPFHNNAQGLDHSGLFGNMNVNKLGLSLNLATDEGRGVLMDLIRWCDVLCESFSPRAMRAWGMDYESLRELRPDLIMLSTCLFGQDGPLSNVAGFGTMGAAIGGFIALAGSPGEDPAGPYSAYTDYLSPRFAVPAILAALDHRDRTGEGCYIDQAQAESSLHFMSTALLDHTVNGHVPELVGNVDRQMAPHGVYRCRGDDEWVAIAVRDNADWSRLCMALGQPGLADDARYADAESRLASADELNALLSEWCAARSAFETERILQAINVPAHAVQNSATCIADLQLQHRGHFVTLDHPVHGQTVVEAAKGYLSETPPSYRSAAPTIGRDNDLVLREILGYDDEQIAQLAIADALT